ncbi:acyl-CoA dehydrogenase family protein [Bacillus sp. 1P10SD]|uniref:acyl-CoA dehydrogenase family protein n=1 Tax=Bacillus sp. 1P10SD TaxID=3132265 RepID=UPI0039A422AE
MFKELQLPFLELPTSAETLREEVREFIKEELSSMSFTVQCDSWLGGYDPEFSRKLGERGWLGMNFPKKYGGHERSALERFVVTEELLAAGAPVAAHWIADRQTGPLLLKFGTEEQKQKYLPKYAKGEWFVAIGLSEPNSGSDLASVSTKAEKMDDGWKINGSKIWTSGAHRAHQMIVFCRTAPRTEDRRAGFSQFMVDLSTPGVTIRPIRLMNGEHHFNEVIFEDVEVSDDMVIGNLGNGWHQTMSDLAYERSGPERFLSTFPLLKEFIRVIGENPDRSVRVAIGNLITRLWTLRRMSLGVAGLLEKGESSDIAAALVKDLGTQFEKDVTETLRLLLSTTPSLNSDSRFEVLMAEAILHAPGFTLRGGATEILRGIIARGLGVR